MAGVDGRDPYEDYLQINRELVLYNLKLEDRPQIVVANKMFGNLDGVKVTKDEVLQPGQEIGTARAVNNTSRHLYLGFKADEQFVNPLDVIPFE